MVKLGIVQTVSYQNNQKGIARISQILRKLGRQETDVVCLPEQWLKDNMISDFDSEFSEFKEIAKDFAMTIIPGAFYEQDKTRPSIIAPIIGPEGEFIGRQEKIHPFDYERETVKPGKEAKIFNTSCKFGVVVCYDMVFPQVANTLTKKGAQVLLSPSRIVKRGITPWHMYVQVRALENRIPVLAANVEDGKFGGNSIIVDLIENNKVVNTKLTKLNKEDSISKEFKLEKYQKNRKIRFLDANKFK